VADDFFIMEKGSVVATGPIAELNENLVQKYLSV
jgi:urea transport system ATP-binding protein